MRLFKLALTIALAMFIIDGATAQAQTTYYSNGDVTWTATDAWQTGSCSGTAAGANYPQAGDTAIICTCDTVTLDANATCANTTIQHDATIYDGDSTYVLTITGSGGLEIESYGVLEFDGSGGVTLSGGGEHTVDGVIELKDTGADLTISASNAILRGSGEISGQHASAVISIGNGIELTSNLETIGITGYLEITGDGTFANQGRVYANSAGNTLKISVATVEDSDNGGTVSGTNFRWGVNTSGGKLLFSTDATGLYGDFYVHAGTLQVGEDPGGTEEIDVSSAGNILFDGGTITVGVDDSFTCTGTSCCS